MSRSIGDASPRGDGGRERPDVRPDRSNRRFDLAWLALAILGLGGFAVLTALAASRAVLPFDGPLRDVALSWSSWRTVWSALSEAANIPLVVIGVAIVAWLFWQRRPREAVLVIITLALVTAGSEAVKQLVARPRPPGSDTVVPGVIYSFPSGHELEAVTILGIVALLVWRSHRPAVLRVGLAIAVAIFCALVAVARVAIDAHYPSDVLAGALGGIGVLSSFALLSERAEAAPRGRAETTGREPGGRQPAEAGTPSHDARGAAAGRGPTQAADPADAATPASEP